MGKGRLLQVRFFISLTLISICSILVLATVLFFWFRDRTVDNMNKANESVLLNTENVFINYRDIVQNYTMDFYRNPNINSLMINGDNSWSDQLYAALNQIRGALTVNPFLESAYIFGISEPVAMFENTPLSSKSKDELFNRVQESRIIDSPFLWTAHMNNGKTKKLMTVFYNDRAFDHSEYYGAVAITIDLNYLQNNLFSQDNRDHTRYAVLNDDLAVLMQSGTQAIGFEESLRRQIVTSSSTRGSFVWKGNRTDQLITYIYSDDTKLWFISEVPYHDSFQDITSARNMMLILSFLLIVIASIIAGFVSHRIYKPIGRLFGNILNLSDDHSASDRGAGLEEANLELERIASKLRDLRKESDDSALIRWLTSPYNPQDNHLASLTATNGIGDSDTYCVAMIAITPDEASDELLPNESLNKLHDQLVLEVELAFKGVGRCRSFSPHIGITVLILSEEAPNAFSNHDVFRKKWDQIALSGASHPHVHCSIGISGLTSDAGIFKTMYDDAMDNLQHVKLHERSNIVYADDILQLSTSAIPVNTLDPVIQAVRQHDTESISKAIDRLLDITCSYRLEPAIIALSKLALELNRFMDNKSLERLSQPADFLDHYQQFWRFRSYRELRTWLEELCYATHEKMVSINNTPTRNLANEAVSYIHQHYNDPTLSLNSLSEKLAISPAYLSKMLSESIGESFPDYVNLIRLEHAQAILSGNLDMDIREIAEKVGYNSSTYFTTQFKKRYGTTPSKWRLNHILQKQV